MARERDKRRQILDTAARLFATRRFDEVTLDDIAARSRLGKGTVYLYFKSKEDLYAELILHGLDTLLTEIRSKAPSVRGVARGGARGGAWRELGGIVDALLAFAARNPHFDALMRFRAGTENARVRERRAELAAACEQVIRRGVQAGEFTDAHPELTAQYVLSFVRIALLYAPAGMKTTTLRAHILRVLGGGIHRKAAGRGRG